MKRTELRQAIFKLLFRVEFHTHEDMEEQKSLFFGDEDGLQIGERDRAYIQKKMEEVTEKIPEMDERLNKEVLGWDTGRMGKVELTILRLALYEILFDESIPTRVAINEAVELAKRFGQDNSPSFVNGVLAKFAE